MSVTPNMNLTAPGVGITAGPEYANQINADLTTIDQHDHTPGKGVPIPSSGLNINADLTFSQYSATDLLTVQMVDAGSTLGGSYQNTLYSYNGDLYFNNGSGASVRMTNGTAINVTSSGISSGTNNASFIGNVLVVTQSPGVAANIDAGSLLIRNNIAGSKKVTLQPPNPIVVDYTLTLPPTPAQTNVMTLDSSGNMNSITWDAVGQNMTSVGPDSIAGKMTNAVGGPPYSGLTAIANNIDVANASILVGKINSTAADYVAATMTTTGTGSLVTTMTAAQANTIVGKINSATPANTVASLRTRATTTNGSDPGLGGVVKSTAVTSFSTTSDIYQDVTNLSVTITTSGRPIFVGLISAGNGGDSSLGVKFGPYSGIIVFAAAGRFKIARGSTEVGQHTLYFRDPDMNATAGQWNIDVPASLYSVDFVPAGTYTYKLQARVYPYSFPTTVYVNNAILVAYEL